MKQKPAIIPRPECQFFQSGQCTLGLYGGAPHAVHCALCISNGNNNPDFAHALFNSAHKTHPPQVRRISGCCDPPPASPF